MIYASIADLVTALNAMALNKGVGPSNSVSVVFDDNDTNNEPVRFIISHTEPYTDSAPLNVLWLVADGSSPDYNKILRRQSRTPANGYNHSWNDQTNIATIYTTQVWDLPEPDDQDHIDHGDTVGDVHQTGSSLGEEGGILTGALVPRTPEGEEEYAMDEVVPRSFMEDSMNVIRGINTSIQQAFTNIFSQLNNLRGRVQVLEASLLGLKGYMFTASEAATEWNIQHNRSNSRVIVNVREGADVIIPKEVTVVDDNNVTVLFAVPVAGTAEVLPIISAA